MQVRFVKLYFNFSISISKPSVIRDTSTLRQNNAQSRVACIMLMLMLGGVLGPMLCVCPGAEGGR